MSKQQKVPFTISNLRLNHGLDQVIETHALDTLALQQHKYINGFTLSRTGKILELTQLNSL